MAEWRQESLVWFSVQVLGNMIQCNLISNAADHFFSDSGKTDVALD